MGFFGDVGDFLWDATTDPFGDKNAARAQAAGQEKALAQQKALADQMTVRGDQGIAGIGAAADQAGGYLGSTNAAASQYLNQGFDSGAGALTGGRDASLGTLGAGYLQGRGDIAGGYGQGRSDLAAGYGQARGDLGQLAGMGSVGAADAYGQSMVAQPGGLYAGFEQDPGYRFRQQQGEQAINRSAAARGGRMGGATMKALSEFNQGLASQEYGNFAQRQQAAAGLQSGLLQNQAGRMDQAALAAQGYRASGMSQLGGLGMQYGQGQAGMSAQGGQALGGMAYGYGSQGAGIQGDYGNTLAGMYGQYGSQQAAQANLYGAGMAGLLTDTANNQANIGIGVGTNNQSAMGSAYQQFADTAGGVEQAAANQKRELAMGALAAFSDARLKTDIEVTPSKYERIGLCGARWTWNGTAFALGLYGSAEGVIAQEVEKLYPQAVVVGDDGWLRVNYGVLDRLVAEAA